jgi:hypothetical protein
MLTNYRFAVPVVILFLLTAARFTLYDETIVYAIIMLCLMPFMFGWMVYSVLLHSDLEHPLVEFKTPDFKPCSSLFKCFSTAIKNATLLTNLQHLL